MSAVEKNKDPRREEEASGLGKIHISCCHWGRKKKKAKTGFCFFCDPEVTSLDFVTRRWFGDLDKKRFSESLGLVVSCGSFLSVDQRNSFKPS